MHSRITLIIFLTLVWCGFSNDFTWQNIIIGILLSALINFIVAPKKSHYRMHILVLIQLCAYMIWELFVSSMQVAWEVITPQNKSQPKIVKLPMHDLHSIQISLLANFISLTPGTLTIDVPESKEYILVHIMFAQNEEKILNAIYKKLTPMIKRAFYYV